MKALDITAAVLLIALAIVHCTGVFFDAPAMGGLNALWSFSGGLFVGLVGALNLLRIRYGAIAFGVRAVSAAANVVLLALTALLAGALGMAHHVHSIAVVAVVLASTLLSFRPVRRQAESAASS